MIDRLKPVTEPLARRPRLTLGVIAAVILAAVVIVVVSQVSGSSSAGSTLATAKCFVNCGSGPRVSPPVPAMVRMPGAAIPIVPVDAAAIDWESTTDAGSAEWLAGTVVNYVVGLPESPENLDLMQGLIQGDAIELDLADGQTLKFQYTGQQEINRRDTDLFAQTSPGLTLVLLSKDGTERLVASAQHMPNSDTDEPPSSSLGRIQSPIEIGPVRVTVLSTRYLPADPGLPNGPAYFLVDFLAENTGAEPIDTGQFAIELHDYGQRKYSVSEGASLLGSNASVTGTLEPGGSALFTTGFEFSRNATSPLVVWNFKPSVESAGRARVALPVLNPTPTPEPWTQVAVQLSQAYFSPDQSTLIFVVGLRNPTAAAVPIEVSDVSLANAEGVLAQLVKSDPALPYVLRPGQSATLTLRFSRIPGDAALLKVLMNEFQVKIG